MIKTDVLLPLGYTSEDIRCAICAALPIEAQEMREVEIVKRTLDISDKCAPKYKATVAISLSEERERGLLKMKKKVLPYADYSLNIPQVKPPKPPIVVGFGPCGMLAALTLAEAGCRPIVLERGLSVDERSQLVSRFNSLGILDPECNIQYGEGGAGTYSDGKLKVGSMDKYKMKVLREFCSAGAPEEILYTMGAHLGTDKLSGIVKNIREKIISLGGSVIFGARLVDVIIKDERITAVKYIRAGKEEILDTDTLILAIGHSARDTFESLLSRGVSMEQRGFGIGVRIEHPREYINQLVYGKGYDARLGAASYHLVTHLESGRSVYSFCMCPGGSVVAAANEVGGVVTNGMSEYNRDGENSNAAFLVSVTPSDFQSAHPLAGMDLQRKIEGRTYNLAGSNYMAPAIRMEDFLSFGSESRHFPVKPTYPRGVVSASPDKYLPEYITTSLRLAISDFDAWMPGFNYPDAVITGCETRSTSPVRMPRTEALESISVKGLYPAGEGAGYSGGIVSSARDGVIVAMAIIDRLL